MNTFIILLYVRNIKKFFNSIGELEIRRLEDYSINLVFSNSESQVLYEINEEELGLALFKLLSHWSKEFLAPIDKVWEYIKLINSREKYKPNQLDSISYFNSAISFIGSPPIKIEK